jgi:hypothetical protein
LFARAGLTPRAVALTGQTSASLIVSDLAAISVKLRAGRLNTDDASAIAIAIAVAPQQLPIPAKLASGIPHNLDRLRHAPRHGLAALQPNRIANL